MFEDLCDTAFWDSNLTWNTTTPDLTPCFQSTFLIFVPCGIFWLLSILEFLQAYRNKRRRNPWSKLAVGKMVLNALMLALALVNAVCQFYKYYHDLHQVVLSNIVSSSCEVATFVLLCGFSMYIRTKGLVTSKVLSIFWLLLSVSLGFRFYSSFLPYQYNGDAVSYTAVTTLRIMLPTVLVQLVLSAFTESFSDFHHLENDIDQEEDNCRLKNVSLFSSIFFTWMTRILLDGAKRKIDICSLPPLCRDMISATVRKPFDAAYFKRRHIGRLPVDETENRNMAPKFSKPSLVLVLAKTAWWPLLISAIFELLFVLISLIPSFMLKFILNFVQSTEEHWHGYVYALGFYLAVMFKSMVDNLCQYFSLVASIRIKSSLTSAVYRKSLRLSNSARSQYMSGQIVNLMAVDTQEIFEFTEFVADFWSIPLRVGTSIFFLWQILGLSSLSAVGVILAVTPVSMFVSHYADKLQERVMTRKDDRLKEMSEILNGIKVLKLYAWEKPFMKRVLDIRADELSALKTGCYLEAFFAFLWISAPLVIALTCFTVYSLSDSSHILNAETIFVSISFILLLKVPMGRLPDMIARLIRAHVSLVRVGDFLFTDELDPFAVGHQPNPGDAITVDDATLTWSADIEPSLHNISLSVPKGSLLAVVGSIGAGKSSLFSALLGDMKKISGSLNIEGSIGYVPQQAWIQNATLQNNIIFTQRFKQSRYQKVIDACALKADLELLPGGDKAEIGEKGINLSGGQKQRVSLARAIYQDVDIYLLDDTLSAVDAHVATHIFQEVIGPTGVLRNKTRILATHNISFLSKMDAIIVMDEGRIIEQGTYVDLMDRKGHLYSYLQQHMGQNGQDEPEDVKPAFAKRQLSSIQPDGLLGTDDDTFRLTEEEGTEYGRVKWDIYKGYISTIGIPYFVVTVIAFFGSGAFEIGCGIWLGNSAPPEGNAPAAREFLTIYGVLIGFHAVMNMVSYMMLNTGSVNAAGLLHNDLLTSVMRCPLSFFDTTPAGRILNRFGKDVESMDMNLPFSLANWLNMMTFFPILLAVISSASPYVLLITVPVLVMYFFILRVYIKTSNQLRRLDSVSKSPLYTNFSETLSGATSIRAFRAQNYFINRSNKHVDENLKCYYLGQVSARWLDSILTIISGFIVLSIAMVSVLGRGSVEAGLLGLILNYCVEVTDGLSWLVKMTADVENQIVSLERIREYSHLKSEAEWEIAEKKPALSWPEKGSLEIEEFTVAYRDGLDPVLKDINLKIRPAVKVGIVGRTGAGKSSLILSLFRIMEPSRGKVVIDGVDISQLGLYHLRSKLTVIPQDPVLFSGTLRMNLDPWEECTDDQIWTSLERAHLKSFVSTLKDGLSHLVTEGGDNLSAGQRQLVCLARALLRHTKILVLDEATASVDLDTDRLIQATIREAFASCTIITIAHRLHTIMDYDRIIVLSQGFVVEDGSPDSLLKDPLSHFYSMAKDAGLV